MKRPKREPADASRIAVRAMVAAASPLPACPAYVVLREQDRPFWEAILHARARHEWDESDMAVGVQLARCRADIEAESKLLDNESSVIKNKRGAPVVNPRVGVLDLLSRRETMLMRALRIGGGPVPTRDLNKRRGVQRAAERALEALDDDDEMSLLR